MIPVRDEIVEPHCLLLRLSGTDQRFDLFYDLPDFTSQKAFLLDRQPLCLSIADE